MSYELAESGMNVAENIWKVVSAAGAVVMMYLTGKAKYRSLSVGNDPNPEKVVIDPAELENMVGANFNGLNLRHAISLEMLGKKPVVTASELARQYGTSEVQLSMLRKEVNESL